MENKDIEKKPIEKKGAGIFEGVRSFLLVAKTVVKYASLIMVLVTIVTYAINEVEKWVQANE